MLLILGNIYSHYIGQKDLSDKKQNEGDLTICIYMRQVEDNCQLNTVSEIASAVHEMVAMIIKEEAMSC